MKKDKYSIGVVNMNTCQKNSEFFGTIVKSENELRYSQMLFWEFFQNFGQKSRGKKKAEFITFRLCDPISRSKVAYSKKLLAFYLSCSQTWLNPPMDNY